MLGVAAVAAASACVAAPASAQSWPTQRVTIVVPFGAGCVTDILARIFADEMGKRWGQQVIVENRPGLAGTAAVAKATPDGYTLMVTSNGHTVAGLVTKDAPFDPVKDFAGITRLGSAPLFLITHPGRSGQDPEGSHRARQGGARQAQFLLAGPRQHHVHRRRAVPQGRRHQHRPRAVPQRARCGDRRDPRRRADVFRAGQSGAAISRRPARCVRSRPRPRSAFRTCRTCRPSPKPALPFVYDSWFGLMAPAGVPQADPREDQQGLGRCAQDAGDAGQAQGAVPDRRHRHAGGDWTRSSATRPPT